MAKIDEQLDLELPIAAIAKPSPSPLNLAFLDDEELLPDQDSKLGFAARFLVHATLPHKDPGHQPGANEFRRCNGAYTLHLMAPAEIGLPYGVHPRRVLAYITTQCVRERTATLSLGKSFGAFALKLGVQPSSGPRGQLRALQDQMHRLLSLTVSCFNDAATDDLSSSSAPRARVGFCIASKHALWWQDDGGSEHGESFLTLSTDFFAEILERPIPMDLGVYRRLQSPMAMDIYAWLTARSLRTQRIGRPETVPWTRLHSQFGSDFSEIRFFKRHFLKHLATVLGHYPEARVEPVPQGLKLRPYPPHIARVQSLALPFGRR